MTDQTKIDNTLNYTEIINQIGNVLIKYERGIIGLLMADDLMSILRKYNIEKKD